MPIEHHDYSDNHDNGQKDSLQEIAFADAVAKKAFAECQRNIPGLKERLIELIDNGNIIRPTGCSPKNMQRI